MIVSIGLSVCNLVICDKVEYEATVNLTRKIGTYRYFYFSTLANTRKIFNP